MPAAENQFPACRRSAISWFCSLPAAGLLARLVIADFSSSAMTLAHDRQPSQALDADPSRLRFRGCEPNGTMGAKEIPKGAKIDVRRAIRFRQNSSHACQGLRRRG